MSERDEKREKVEETFPVGSSKSQATDPCADIKDPVRRGLCRVCQVPGGWGGSLLQGPRAPCALGKRKAVEGMAVHGYTPKT